MSNIFAITETKLNLSEKGNSEVIAYKGFVTLWHRFKKVNGKRFKSWNIDTKYQVFGHSNIYCMQ